MVGIVVAPAVAGAQTAATDQYTPGGGGGGQNPDDGGGNNPGGGGGDENPADGGGGNPDGAENPAAGGGGGGPTAEGSAGNLPFTGYPMTTLLWIVLALVVASGLLRAASGRSTRHRANAPPAQ